MGIFARNSGFIVLAHIARSGSNNLCGWLTGTWSQQWSMSNEVEMPRNTKA